VKINKPALNLTPEAEKQRRQRLNKRGLSHRAARTRTMISIGGRPPTVWEKLKGVISQKKEPSTSVRIHGRVVPLAQSTSAQVIDGGKARLPIWMFFLWGYFLFWAVSWL